MKKQIMTAAVLSAAATLWFSGCSPNATQAKLSDGTAGDIAMEFTQMSTESSAGALAKTTADLAAAADTVVYSGEIVLQPWTYDPAGKWWTRIFKDSLASGRTLTRTDSLQFADAASQLLAVMPAWVTTTGWTHIRHVVMDGLVNTFDSRFAMSVVVAKGSDTTATWNGTVTGIWDSSVLSNTTVTNVVRKFANVDGIHWWRFPSSGTIYIDNPLRTWTVTFTGDGGATAVVTLKSNNKQKTFTISLTTGQENE